MRTVLTGAATLVFAATIGVLPTTAFAEPGGGHGNGKGADNGPAMKHGNGGGNGGAMKIEHGPASMSDNAADRGSDRGPSQAAAKAQAKGDGKAMARPDKASRSAPQRAERGPPFKMDKADKTVGKPAKQMGGRSDMRTAPTERFAERNVHRVSDIPYLGRGPDHGLIEGCPPGLARKNNGCTPPGQIKKRSDRWQAFYDRPSWWGYSGLTGGNYRYGDGYLYRLGSGDSVLGYIPLLGGALAVGNPWPSFYQPVQVPNYYVDYYNLGPQGGYRYADNVIYRVDPGTQAITSIAALLTGDRFAVGQPMPAGYDVYNVPYGYQDQYNDGPDSYCRYADGYVYQVDPTTRLITAAIQLLT